LGVHAEAVHVDDAMTVFEEMKGTLQIAPDNATYESLIRMFVRAKDLDSALKMKTDMQALQLVPTQESFGLLVRAFTHRDMIVEALQMVEEAKRNNVPILERNLTVLRNRCKKLGVTHPDLGPDPLAWAKQAKTVRRNMKESSQRSIQSLQSVAWH
jgi:pentatricopeptide repeat protein